MLPVPRAQKLNTKMNVELVVGQEVFGQQADGITSQPLYGYPLWVTINIGDLGKLREGMRLKVWHVHGKLLDLYRPFLPNFSNSR